MALLASPKGDKYRSYLSEDEVKDIKWRYGAPPNYDVVNKLFEEGRTKVWAAGSLEEKVQNLVKTWEMEMFHKISPEDYKTVDPEKYLFSLNGWWNQSLIWSSLSSDLSKSIIIAVFDAQFLQEEEQLPWRRNGNSG